MITLRELAAWEDRLAASVRAARGAPEERDRLLTREGVYADYAAVFGSYAALISEDADGLEALKRAAFLAWYAVLEPSFLTGLGDLPDSTVRRVIDALDVRCRVESIDGELEMMVAWYLAHAEAALLRFPGLLTLQRVGERTSGDVQALVPRDGARFADRGLMGAYWRAVVDSLAR